MEIGVELLVLTWSFEKEMARHIKFVCYVGILLAVTMANGLTLEERFEELTNNFVSPFSLN
jgi:hypothetical protein